MFLFLFLFWFLLTLDVKSVKRCKEGSKMALKLILVAECM